MATHIINQLDVEFDFNHEQDAWLFMKDVEGWVKKSLLSVVESVFDEFDISDRVIRIDQLEIDIGRFTPHNIQAGGGEALAHALRQTLQDQLARYRLNQPSLITRIETKKASDDWQCFLETGVLPWYAQLGSQTEATFLTADRFGEWLCSHMAKDPVAAWSGILQHRSADRIFKRLVLQWPAIKLTHLFSYLEKVVNRSPEYKHWLLNFYKAVTARYANSAVPVELLKTVEETLHTYQLNVPPQNASHQHEIELTNEIESREIPFDEPLESADQEQQRVRARLEQILLQAIANRDTVHLLPVWWVIKEHHASVLVAFLRRQGLQAATRDALSIMLSDAMLLDCVDLIDSNATSFVTKLIEHNATIRNARRVAQKATSNYSEFSEQKSKQYVWQLTLGYLLVDRGSVFNQKQYLTHLIRQIAAHDNVRSIDLIQELKARFKTAGQQAGFSHTMFSLLTDVADDWEEPETDDENHEGSQGAQSQSTAIQAKIIEAIESAKDVELAEFLKEMNYQQQVWLATIFKQYANNTDVIRRLVSQCQQATLQAMLTVIAPEQAQGILAVIKQPVLVEVNYFRADRETASSRSRVLNTPKTVLWEVSFQYALADHGSEFNQQNFMRALIKGVAAHHNLNANNLLLSLIAALEVANRLSGEQNPMLGLLQSLATQLPIASQDQSTITEVNAPSHDNHSTAQQTPNTQTIKDNGSKAAERWTPAEQWTIEYRLYQLVKHWYLTGQWQRRELKNLQLWLKSQIHQQKEATIEKLQWVLEAEQVSSLLTGLHRTQPQLMRRFLTLITENRYPHASINSKAIAELTMLVWAYQQPSVPANYQQAFRASIYGQSIASFFAGTHTPEQPVIILQKMLRGETIDLSNLTYAADTPKHQDVVVDKAPQDVSEINKAKNGLLPTPVLDAYKLTLVRFLQRLTVQGWQPFSQFLIDVHTPESELTYRWLNRLKTADGALDELIFVLYQQRYSELARILQAAIVRPDIWQQLTDHVSDRSAQTLVEIVQASKPNLANALDDVAEAELQQSRKNSNIESETENPNESESESESEAESVTNPDDVENEELLQESLYIMNAGLVIACAYIPRLFGMLELMESNVFKSEQHQEKAIHLLQWLVTGQDSSPESMLILNKLLCGAKLVEPIALEAELTDHEKQTLEGMLNGIKQNWPPVSNTSIDGLRDSFLIREGCLQHDEDHWVLTVQSKPFDMLLDQLPWNFSYIKFPWMPEPLQVNWR